MHKEQKKSRNILLILMYDGSRYEGWQRLGKGKKEKTIQGILEEILGELLKEEINVIGSGRTDGGVHAFGQTANFHSVTNMDCSDIKVKLNEKLPEDIVVTFVKEVSKDFHSRYDAKSKTYEYRIDTRAVPSVFTRKYAYSHPEPLDEEAMIEAASYLIGEHDFRGFSSKMNDKRTTIRTIYQLDVRKDTEEIRIVIKGNGFLYNMVRIIVGTLLLVGEGKMSKEDVNQVLITGNRTEAGPTISSQGLYLKSVDY